MAPHPRPLPCSARVPHRGTDIGLTGGCGTRQRCSSPRRVGEPLALDGAATVSRDIVVFRVVMADRGSSQGPGVFSNRGSMPVWRGRGRCQTVRCWRRVSG